MDIDVGLAIAVIGLVLAIPLGIAANLLTSRLISFLEKRKLIKTHKTRQQALQIYNRTRAFKEGRRDRYPYYMMLTGSAVVCAVVASTVVIVIVLVSPNFEIAVVMFGIAIMFALMSVALFAAIYETTRKLERFDDYKKEFEALWGPLSENDLKD
jgi:hypothetical protein